MPRLYVVATPIGNLGDLSGRVRDALAGADLIAAEDTRVAMKLLNHLGLSKPTISCHRHNERSRAAELVARMQGEDLTVALTSDAGTPAISDPGHILVDAAWAAGIPVVPIAGPSALATALSAAGFDAAEFGFFGFLPRERGRLREKLSAIRALNLRVAVAHESPHRVVALVDE
ncbi:MAG: 16S rRNA (cytidine(1402)-2'-O)-methyltransferase, partial [Clostridiales bacterium]|nr:16S rRNA (cytidine(1402)-2'-O)-methyltransferase [Clostridiales bacterium]